MGKQMDAEFSARQLGGRGQEGGQDPGWGQPGRGIGGKDFPTLERGREGVPSQHLALLAVFPLGITVWAGWGDWEDLIPGKPPLLPYSAPSKPWWCGKAVG